MGGGCDLIRCENLRGFFWCRLLVEARCFVQKIQRRTRHLRMFRGVGFQQIAQHVFAGIVRTQIRQQCEVEAGHELVV